MSIPFNMTNSGINIFVDGTMKPVGTDHPNYPAILEIVLDTSKTIEDVKDLLDVAKSIEKFSDGKIVIEGDTFKYEGIEMHNALTDRILHLLKEKEDVSILIKFMENLMQNPSFRAVNELYGFLEACNLPITVDGHFLAYKKVNYDYKSLHKNPDGTRMDNSLGKEVSMPRNQVDEDSNRTCSKGLHCASFGYMSHYGGQGKDTDDRLIVVKVNPADVVAVPKDYDNQKMRVCKYVVIDELPNDGLTEIVDWVYGNRDIAFLRDTISALKNLAIKFFGLEDAPKFTSELYSRKVSTVKREEFLAEVINDFKLKTTFETYMTRYDESLTVKNLLQWVSNYKK